MHGKRAHEIILFAESREKRTLQVNLYARHRFALELAAQGDISVINTVTTHSC
jgi:hypothetical protein